MLLDNVPQYNQQFYRTLQKEVQKAFENRIICFLIHGSSLYYGLNNRPFSDIDAELVLNTSKVGDYKLLKDISNQLKVPTELQLRYEYEVSNINSLQRSSEYKIFLFYPYSNGLTVIGKNIYSKLKLQLSEDEIKKGILVACQIEYKNIRKLYGRDNTKENIYLINKTINRFFTLLLTYYDILSYKQLGTKDIYKLNGEGIINLLIVYYKEILDITDLKNLELYLKYRKEYRFNSKIMFTIDKIYSNHDKKLKV